MASTRIAMLEDRGVLAVSGADRRAFLQGLVSNDIDKLSPDRAVYAALLTAQGKYLHDFMMIEHGNAIWLETERARLGDLKRRLSLYRLRARISIDERPELAIAAVFGDAAPAALALPTEAGRGRPLDGGAAFVDPRLPELGVRLITGREHLLRLVTDHNLANTDFADYDRHRLALGVPDGSRDLVVEKSILLESGFDELNGVDWQKGCYIGQELTARTKYRGLVKKRLFPVKIDGPPPPPDASIAGDGREAGEMRSSSGDVGLALLRLDAVAAKNPLSAGGATLQPFVPSWMRIERDA